MACVCSGGDRHLFILNNLFWSENFFQKDFTSLVRGFRGKIFKYVLFFDQIKDIEVLTFSFIENFLLLPSCFGIALEHMVFSQSTGWLQGWIQNFSCKKEGRDCLVYQSYEQVIKEAHSPSWDCKHHHLHCTPGKMSHGMTVWGGKVRSGSNWNAMWERNGSHLAFLRLQHAGNKPSWAHLKGVLRDEYLGNKAGCAVQ